MARTEKKFNQVNQPAANTSVEIIGAAANRKNVLFNMTGRSNAVVTLYTASAPLVFNPTSVSVSGLSSQTGTVFNTSASNSSFYNGIAMNPAKTAFATLGYAGSQYPGLISFTTSSSGVATTSSSANTFGGSQWYQQDSSWDSGSYFWTSSTGYYQTPRLVVMDNTYAILYAYTSGNSGTYYKSGHFNWSNAGSPSPTGHNSSPTDASHTWDGGYGPFGVHLVRPGTTASNPGVGMIQWQHRTSSVASGTKVMGQRIYRNGVQTNCQWTNDSSSSDQSATNLCYFWHDIEYNSVYPMYAITTPTFTSANTWHGRSSSGGTITGTATLPSIENAKYGFRLVAATSAGTDAAEFLTGAVTYPSGTMTTLVPTNTSKPIIGMRWSPDGTKLAVLFNRSYSNTIEFTPTLKRVQSNVARLTLNIGNLSDHTIQVGDSVSVSSVGSPFDGTFTVTERTATTISYAVNNANITETSASGTVQCTKTNNLTNSAVAIYTRQQNGSLIETHQSGNNFTNSSPLPYGTAGLAWDSSSTLLAIAGYNEIKIWNFGGIQVPRSTVSSSGGWTVASPNPSITSMTAPTTGSSYPLAASWLAPTTQGSYSGVNKYIEVMEWVPVAGALTDVLVVVRTSFDGSQRQFSDVSWGNTNNIGTISGTATVSNYINTIAQSVPVTLGSVTQLSNIVVEPNERIYVEANTSNAVDIVAYGVEIT